MADKSIEDKILEKIRKCGRGYVFFVSDFVNYGTRGAINKALERMTADGTILRVARGIYCYPKIEKQYGLGVISASTEDIALAMARRDGAKIIPTNAEAQNRLGISQQVVVNHVYLTNGPTRLVVTTSGSTIKFKHASPRYFAMKDYLSCLLATALKDWKVENLNNAQKARLKTIVRLHGPFDIRDLKLMPSNVRELVLSFLESTNS